MTLSQIVFSNSFYSQYFDNLISYYNLFKPGIYFFLLGIPFFIRHLPTYWFLFLGIFFNLACSFILFNGSNLFGDEFRYVCFTLFVIPMGAGIVCSKLYEFKYLKPILLVFFIIITGKRAFLQNSETFKYYKSYLLGEQTLESALAKEGSLQYKHYLDMRTSPTEKLLHIGNGNYAVHGESVIHVNSWSKKYPLWENKTPEAAEKWLHGLGVKWVLLERWRYESFAKGFGGIQYIDSPATAYYRGTLSILNSCQQNLVSGSDSRYSLYYFP